MDHEFFTGAMAPDLAGWDWFSLQLADGREVMLYLLRQKDGSVDPASAGTLIEPTGGVRHLKLADFKVKATGSWTSPHTRTKYPAGWEITIPEAGYRLTLTPTLPDQEIRAAAPARVTYWEGQVKIEGVRTACRWQARATPNSPAMPGVWAPGFNKRGKDEKGKRVGGTKFSCIIYKVPKQSLG